jgi:hypothetical protein
MTKMMTTTCAVSALARAACAGKTGRPDRGTTGHHRRDTPGNRRAAAAMAHGDGHHGTRAGDV